MTDDLLAVISRSTDRLWLTRCRDLNRELGRKDVVKAADQRLSDLDLRDALRIKSQSQSIEDRVLEALRVYRAALKHKHNGKNHAAGYTERDIRQYGPREALIRTIRRGKKTSGLDLLAAHNRLDCSYEQIAIDHANELPDDVVELARQTLAEFNSP